MTPERADVAAIVVEAVETFQALAIDRAAARRADLGGERGGGRQHLLVHVTGASEGGGGVKLACQPKLATRGTAHRRGALTSPLWWAAFA